MAKFAGTCVSRHGLANGARPSRRRLKNWLCERANPAGLKRNAARHQSEFLRGAHER
jgi:hypothetical protein